MRNNETIQDNKKKTGCSNLLIFIISLCWIIGITLIAQLMAVTMEQAIFEGSFNFPDLRWLINFAYTTLVTLPFLMLFFILSDPMLKRIFKFWGMLGFLGFLTTPIKLIHITNMTLIGIIQLITLIILFTGYHFYFKKLNKSSNQKINTSNLTYLFVLLIVSLVTIPWILWGALGSMADIVINLLVSFTFALFFVSVFINNFPIKNPEFFDFNESTIFPGFILFGGLVILSTLFGQSGQQILLVLILPLSAWVLVRFILDLDAGFFPSIIFLTGLISLPLLWVDPDEINLVVSSGSGELISWVNRMILLTNFLILLITTGLGLFNKKIKKPHLKFLIDILPIVWIIIGVLYFKFGQPGFYGETLFVVMKDQVDLSNVSDDWDYLQKRETVYDSMTNFAEESQQELKIFLDQFHIEYTSYYLVNAIEVKGGPILRLILESRGDVDRVLDNPYLRPLAEELPPTEGYLSKPTEQLWNLQMIQAPQVWSEIGVTGEGIVIGQSDSGVDFFHPELKNSYAGIEGNGDYTWLDPWFYSTTPQDFGGHGTHTLGTIVGVNTGVAPGASWIGCVNLARNLGNPAYYLDCLQFMLAPYPQNGNPFSDGVPAKGAHVLNNSWGCPVIEGCDPDVFLTAVNGLRKAGIFVVVSAGNSGYSGCGSVSDPLAIYDDVVSVGAINEEGFLTQFSSLGPVKVDGSGRIKPDLVAPGDLILSSLPNGTYGEFSGTSMAGPHVVGVVALMWSANPDLIGNVEDTEKILFDTASPFEGVYPTCIGAISDPNNAVGFGVVNAKRAVEAAQKNK